MISKGICRGTVGMPICADGGWLKRVTPSFVAWIQSSAFASELVDYLHWHRVTVSSFHGGDSRETWRSKKQQHCIGIKYQEKGWPIHVPNGIYPPSFLRRYEISTMVGNNQLQHPGFPLLALWHLRSSVSSLTAMFSLQNWQRSTRRISESWPLVQNCDDRIFNHRIFIRGGRTGGGFNNGAMKEDKSRHVIETPMALPANWQWKCASWLWPWLSLLGKC